MAYKSMLAASMVVAATMIPAVAQAAVGTPYNNYVPLAQSGTFGNNGGIGNTTFTNTFTFVVTKAGTLASNFSNTNAQNNGSADIDFTSATLTGGSLSAAGLGFTKLLSDPLPETWNAPNAFLGVGTYTLTIVGQAFGTPATYSGNFSVTAVPEIATWAMMILGVGAIGAVQRRRMTTKVRFA